MSSINTSDTICCVNCFSEEHIRQFVNDQDTIGDCGYCGSTNTSIRRVDEVGQFIMEGILRCYKDAAGVGGDLFPSNNIEEILLWEEDIFSTFLTTPKNLVDDFGFDNSIDYITKNPFGPPPGRPDEIEHWQNFCETVKREKRFTVFLDVEGPDPYDPQRPKNLLSIIANHFFNEQLDCYYPGKKIYRARIKRGSLSYNHEQLTSPPLNNTRNSRMSPVGISFFYGGNDSSTCIHEIRPSVGEIVMVAEFEVIRELTILTFPQNIGLSRSKYDPDYVYSYDEFFLPFLEHFISDISRPIRDTDSDVEYVPGQVFTEFIKTFNFDWAFTNAGSDKSENDPVFLNGLSFPSSLKIGGQNIVLFRGPDISTEDIRNKGDAWLLYKGSTEGEITDVAVSSKPLT